MRMRDLLRRDFRLPYSPRLFFPFLLVPEILLAYGPRIPSFMLWISAGLALPFFLILASMQPPRPSEKPAYLLESFPAPSPFLKGMMFLLLALGTAARLWNLGSPDWWLGGLQSLMALEAVKLLRHWTWTPFVTLGQDPSPLSYACLFAWKATGSPILGYQLPPAVISLLTLAAAYPCARQYFSRSASWACLGLVALNEWALMIARPLLPGITSPLWEIGVLYFLGRFLKAGQAPSRKAWACALGFSLGLGPYTFFSWPTFFPAALCAAGLSLGRKSRKERGAAGLLVLFQALGLAPFVFSAFQEGYGGYLKDASALTGFNALHQARIAAGYLAALWGGGATQGVWLPSGGGFLNALLGACFFMGALELYRFRALAVPRFLAAAFVLGLLPGFLSHDIETHRILLALPVTLAVAAIGLQAMLLSLKPSARIPVLAAVLALSAGLDLGRSGLFQAPAGDEQKTCYGVLSALARQEGPGLVFCDMIPFTLDSSLAYCTYPFNAAWNPQWEGRPVKWAALFTERQYAAPLSRRFPRARWVELPSPEPGLPSRHVLGLFALDPGQLQAFAPWKAYSFFNLELDARLMDIPSSQNRRAVLEQLLAFYPSVPGDPYLQSCFFEKLLYHYSWEKSFHPEDPGADWADFSAVFQRSFAQSYQDVVLCGKFGRLLAAEGSKAEARRVFAKALRLSPGNGFLRSEMEQLGLSDTTP